MSGGNGVDITFEWVGAKELAEKFAKLGLEAPKIIGRVLYTEAQLIMTESKSTYVPVDLGILKDSGHVEEPKFKADGVEVVMGYGGAAKDYALYQHENMELHHPKQGGPKYLTTPAEAHSDELRRKVLETTVGNMEK